MFAYTVQSIRCPKRNLIIWMVYHKINSRHGYYYYYPNKLKLDWINWKWKSQEARFKSIGYKIVVIKLSLLDALRL